ncbi:MAG: hypothetical protein MRY59_12055 [Aquisalinus sp.]|nr:hypothetical protein [Aquisalinus sp.]
MNVFEEAAKVESMKCKILACILLLQMACSTKSTDNLYGKIFTEEEIDDILITRLSGIEGSVYENTRAISGVYIEAIGTVIDDMLNDDTCGNEPTKSHLYFYSRSTSNIKIIVFPRSVPFPPIRENDVTILGGGPVQNSKQLEGCIYQYTLTRDGKIVNKIGV